VPFLKDPGYGKEQVAISITALQDAFHRSALDSVEDGRSTLVDVVAAGGGWTTNAAKKSAARRASRGRGRPTKRQRTIDDLQEVRHYPCVLRLELTILPVVYTTGHLSTFSVGPPSL